MNNNRINIIKHVEEKERRNIMSKKIYLLGFKKLDMDFELFLISGKDYLLEGKYGKYAIGVPCKLESIIESSNKGFKFTALDDIATAMCYDLIDMCRAKD